MSLHSKLTKIHVAENWVYGNAAARTSATGFATDGSDIGKLAYQSDEGSYWRLLSNTPTWQSVGTSLADPSFPRNWYFITALTGGTSVNLDGQDASKLSFGHLVLITIADSTSGYQYQNGAPNTAQGDVAVLNSTTTRWRKTIGF